LLPRGVELDEFHGRTLLGAVGLVFRDARALGVPLLGHRRFAQVNLRFYVRRRAPDGMRHGAVFVRQLVGRRAVAWGARVLYGENADAAAVDTAGERAYRWRFRGRDGVLSLAPQGEPQEAVRGSLEEFVTQRLWGYVRRRDGSTLEYRVAHPTWRIRPAESGRLEGALRRLYGDALAGILSAPPAHALLAEGSRVAVYLGRRLEGRA
jgi:uncharacterized protein YqjF (DUF2071 family)